MAAYALRFATLLVIAWMVVSGLDARSSGTGGGSGQHGGSGGHASSGGHAGHGGFSSGAAGHSVGHAIGHSVGRLFGGHGKKNGTTPDLDPFTSTAAVHAKNAGPSGSWVMTAGSRFHHHHHPFFNDFPFGNRFPFFPRNGFGFAGCGGFPRRRFFSGDGFNCFETGFFFDPFFVDDFSIAFAGGSAEEGSDNPAANSMASMEAESDTDAQVFSSGAYVSEPESRDQTESANGGIGVPNDTKNEEAVTLLQLRDGSMYGLTRYSLEGDTLRYRTTYGGEGSVKLDRIDLAKTKQLNAEREIIFDLTGRQR
jgi:hypothetical protein